MDDRIIDGSGLCNAGPPTSFVEYFSNSPDRAAARRVRHVVSPPIATDIDTEL
jgi:hypothetical protein